MTTTKKTKPKPKPLNHDQRYVLKFLADAGGPVPLYKATKAKSQHTGIMRNKAANKLEKRGFILCQHKRNPETGKMAKMASLTMIGAMAAAAAIGSERHPPPPVQSSPAIPGWFAEEHERVLSALRAARHNVLDCGEAKDMGDLFESGAEEWSAERPYLSAPQWDVIGALINAGLIKTISDNPGDLRIRLTAVGAMLAATLEGKDDDR